MQKIFLRIVLALLFSLLLLCVGSGGTVAAAADVHVVTVEGAIDPAVADYVERTLRDAEQAGVQAYIMRLNTPGGLGTSMDKITGLLLNSKVPTVVYVAPNGAQAFSAGTFILLSANFAVVHPGATIGAAHPVQLFGTPQPQGEQGKEAAKRTDAMTEKVVNAYATKARSIAESRGRNGDWAENVVRHNRTATAARALQIHAVDAIQPNMAALLAWLNGRTTTVGEGEKVTVQIKGAKVVEVPMSLKDSFLHQIADPNLLLIFIVLAALGILFELQNPGAILPGVVGGISLLLALYLMSVLPVTTTGLALIGFGLLLLILDIKLPSHGILSLGGIASFVIGGIMLVDSRYAGVLRMSLVVIIAMAVFVGGFFVVAIGAAVRIHRRQPTTGMEGMIGQIGRTLTELTADTAGQVFVAGEEWRARSDQGTIAPSERVEVERMDGLTLVVRKVS